MVGGSFVLAELGTYAHTHACAFTHFSVGLQARKAVATLVSLRSDVSAGRDPQWIFQHFLAGL